MIKSNIVRLTITALVFLSLTQTMVTRAEVHAEDLLMDVPGYIFEGSLYTYSEYVTMLDEISITPSDFIYGTAPTAVILASYSQGDVYVWLEILEFETVEDAVEEYDRQISEELYDSSMGYRGYNGLMFQRFSPRERVFQYDRFIFLVFFSPLDNTVAYQEADRLLPGFISHALDVIGNSPPDPPSSVVDATWGVEPGDVISWSVDDASFTGSMGTGHSASQSDYVGEWEIADVQNGYVLVKQSSGIQHIYTEDETRLTVDIPFDDYTWMSPEDGALTLRNIEGDAAGPVLYPLTFNGASLLELVEDRVDYLPDVDKSEDGTRLSFSGRTPQYSGFTPIETQWMDITVHKGTGIVTYYEFYYNNNEYSITTSTSMSLYDTSFTLSSRTAETPELEASTTLSHSSLTQGDALTVMVQVLDQNNDAVTDAQVTAVINTNRYILTHQDSGNYETSIDTSSFQPATLSVTVTAEKAGYLEASDVATITVTQRQSSSTSTSGETDSPEESGIPGYPPVSVALGVAVVAVRLLFSRKKLGN
ncbi:MAG: hypothetical protein NWE89_15790 [Candidatus Bathyarchaeota archaeon]|nr:hypothetical protein [Candidatus Bathyarchaeota archaeon]